MNAHTKENCVENDDSANSTSDCWRSKCNAQALSLPLLHENRTLFLSRIIRKPCPKLDFVHFVMAARGGA